MSQEEEEFQSPFEEQRESNSRKGDKQAANGEEEEWRPAFPEEEEGECQSFQSSQRQKECQVQQISDDSVQSLSLKKQDDLFQSQDFDFEDFDQPYAVEPFPQPAQQSLRSNQLSFQKSLQSLLQKLNDPGGHVLSSHRVVMVQEGQEWLRRQDKIVAAFAFINRGYGLTHLKEQVRCGGYKNYKIDEGRYKSISGSMVREVYRRLQSFLLRDCRLRLESLAGYEMKLLQTLLLNCRTTLSATCCRCFLEVVKITYSLDDVVVGESECLQLYNQIVIALKQKMNFLRGQSVTESDSFDEVGLRSRMRPKGRLVQSGRIDPNFITPRIERQIILVYMREHGLSRVRDIVRREFRIDESKLNIKVIRNIVRRVMRASIRKMETVFNQENPFDRNTNYHFSDQNVKYILQAGDASRLRIRLCQLYLNNCRDQAAVATVHGQLCEFLKSRVKSRLLKDKMDVVFVDDVL